VLAVRDTISESEKACEEAINYINGEVYHRRDVATEALLNEKIEHMKEIRG
jgi:phosphoribosylamine--glycine ligase